MAVAAGGIGIAGVLGGLAGAWNADLPAGPAIVCAVTILFLLGVLVGAVGRGRRKRAGGTL